MSERVEVGAASRPEANRRSSVSTDLMMLIAVLIWGVNFTGVKVALASMAPLAFNGVRFALATVVIMGFLAWQARATHNPGLLRIRSRDLGAIVLLGLAGHSIYQVLFPNGLARTSPGNASLMMATSPIWVLVLGYALRVEKINRVMALGILLSFAGIVALVTGGGNVSLGSANLLGDLMILGCSILWAVYTVGSKPLLKRYSPVGLTAWSMLAGTGPLLLFSIPDLRRQDWTAVPPIAWAALLFSALLSVVVAYVIWYISVQRVGNARTAIYSNLTPVVAILFAWLTIGAALSPVQLLGGGVVLLGLIVTRQGRSK